MRAPPPHTSQLINALIIFNWVSKLYYQLSVSTCEMHQLVSLSNTHEGNSPFQGNKTFLWNVWSHTHMCVRMCHINCATADKMPVLSSSQHKTTMNNKHLSWGRGECLDGVGLPWHSVLIARRVWYQSDTLQIPENHLIVQDHLSVIYNHRVHMCYL